MGTRGEIAFLKFPRLAARLYDTLTSCQAMDRQFGEIAEFIEGVAAGGRLLDVGTGPGRLLLEIQRRCPAFELVGLDISETMIERARRNLADIEVDLRCGTIRRTTFPDDHFDLIVCTGSLYLWDEPVECVEEVFRILRPGGAAYFFETKRDYSPESFERAVRRNRKKEGWIHGVVAPKFLRKQMRLTYSTAEVASILRDTPFEDSFALEDMTLGGLPVWLRIELTKPTAPDATA